MARPLFALAKPAAAACGLHQLLQPCPCRLSGFAAFSVESPPPPFCGLSTLDVAQEHPGQKFFLKKEIPSPCQTACCKSSLQGCLESLTAVLWAFGEPPQFLFGLAFLHPPQLYVSRRNKRPPLGSAGHPAWVWLGRASLASGLRDGVSAVGDPYTRFLQDQHCGGSDCKPCLQDFTDHSTSTLEYHSPSSILPSLIAEDDTFCASMAEEKEDSSSTELDAPAADLHSSTEDLLSDSALHGTEYYRDLGLLSPPIAKPETAAQPEPAAQAVPAVRLLEENPGALGKMSVDVAFSNPVSCSVRYGEADCRFLNRGHVCSGAAVPGDGPDTSEHPAEAGKELDMQEAKDFFPTLVRSMSTSRRHSWESPLSPVDCKRRFSLDATEMGSDPEQEDEEKGTQPCLQPDVSLQLPKGEVESWSSGGMVIKVEIEPLCPNLVVSPSMEEVERRSNGKRRRSRSVPSACETVTSLAMPCTFDASRPAVEGVESPALEMLEKDHVSPDHVLMVHQVLQELKQYHGAKQRAGVKEGGDSSQQNLTWFEFLSNENEDSGKSDKAEKGTKVMRRLSSLRSRVTGSWQKDKGKNKEQPKEREKEKEPKEPKERWKEINRHQLVPGSFSSCTSCSLCAKPLANKSALQCLSKPQGLSVTRDAQTIPFRLLHPLRARVVSAPAAAGR
ncbi:uncharacterized protein LJ264_013687 [Porphyrio hochstetteri]